MMLRRIIFLSALMGVMHVDNVLAFPRTNLFNPYDILLFPEKWADSCWQLTVGYEGAVHTKAFAPCKDHAVNVLDLWQKEQDGIAAFKGQEATTDIGQYAQKMNIDDDDHAHGIFSTGAKLSIPVNAMFALRYHFPHNITFGVFLPYYVARLHDVCLQEKHNDSFFEDILTPDILANIKKLGDLKLTGWKREGVGDLMALGSWSCDFAQNKPWLRNVRLGLRTGLLLPTAHAWKEDLLLGIPFGYDEGAGILVGGTMGFFFKTGLRLGIDLEFLQLFGNTHERRIKTDVAQTDHFLLTKAQAFNDPGFVQHYSLWLEQAYFWRGMSALAAYQYTKQNDNRYYLCTDRYNIVTINDAESVQEWTTHSLVFNLKYDWCNGEERRFKPHLMLFGKWGFNGKRAILADTIGVQLSVSY